MSTDIIAAPDSSKFVPAKYNAMRRAIAECATIDDCNEAQSKAQAMAVYYKQIHDEIAERQMKEIRLRAWRRMSEIVATVDVSKCATQKAMAALVRDTLGHDATHMITDSRIVQLIKLAGVPERSFEAEVIKGTNLELLIYRTHPEQIKKRDDEAARIKKHQSKIEQER